MREGTKIRGLCGSLTEVECIGQIKVVVSFISQLSLPTLLYRQPRKLAT